MATVLIVDDEKNIRTHLAVYIRGLGHQAETAADAADALRQLSRQRVDVVLSDVRMAGMDGMALLDEIHRRYPETIIVLMTAYATVAGAVSAMRAGAYDYLVKPFALDQVDHLLQRVLEVQSLRRENRALRGSEGTPGMLASSNPSMQRVLATARQVADSDVTVLLTGESGTGKNVLARALHTWSSRRALPFVTISCTTLAEHLVESELFGHVKGAFTGAWKDKRGRLEAAAGGTVFLDEVGELSASLQGKLLRFLEDRRFERVGGDETLEADVRILAATNRDLQAEVRSGAFRQDLFFRLSVVPIHLPPLRERREDLPALIDHVLESLKLRHGRMQLAIEPRAHAALLAHPWPGNIRELVNALEHAVVLERGGTITAEDLPDSVLAPAGSREVVPESLQDRERQHVAQVLAESATLEEAAARLGINVTTLWRKRKRWGLE